MTPLRIGPPQTVFQNQYQQIHRITVEFEGLTKEFFVNSLERRVGLLIVRGDDVLLVRQWRLLVNALAWEIPGGRVDPGETPEQAAVREGLEESCLNCRNLKPLLYFHPGLDTFDNPTFLFYTEDFEQATAEHLHKHEVSGHAWMPLPRCIEMIFAKEIVDSLTITALLAYHTRREHPEFDRSSTLIDADDQRPSA